MKGHRTFSILIFPEGKYWVAQCLEYDIATQVKTLKDMPTAIEHAIIGHIIVSKEIGQEPFESLPPAPKEYQDAFAEARRIPDMDAHRFPSQIPKKMDSTYFPQEIDFRVGDAAMA